MGLRPIQIFYLYQSWDRLHFYKRQTVTYKDGPRTEKVKSLIKLHDLNSYTLDPWSTDVDYSRQFLFLAPV